MKICYPLPYPNISHKLHDSMDLPLRPNVCRHFFSERGCSRGDNCRFSHDPKCWVEPGRCSKFPPETRMKLLSKEMKAEVGSGFKDVLCSPP